MLEVSQYLTSDYTKKNHSNENNIVLAQNKHEDQGNRIKDLDTNPGNDSHLITDKGAQNICQRKDSLVNKWFWEN
jgi:hypothetical protein